MSRIEFTRKALDELDRAASWYRLRDPVLDRQFLGAAQETADRIAASPKLNRIILAGNIRRAPFPKPWPYALYYYVRPDRSVVVGALHEKMDARRRLRGRSPG